MKQSKKNKVYFFTFLVSVSTFSYSSSEDAEREALARIISELTLVETMIVEAELKKPVSPQYEFKYDFLKSDIRSVIGGIQSHLSRPSRSPKELPPLQLEYSE